MEMFEGGDTLSKKLFKECNGFCILAHKQCDGKCGDDYCWESFSEKCLNPHLDRTTQEIDKGIYPWKDCERNCIKGDEVCNHSCGDQDLFCQSENTKKCLSIQEKNEVSEK